MKLGKILTRGLGAGMVAYGKTLTDQDARDQKQRELDGVLMREKALADYNHGLSLDTLDKTANTQIATTDSIERIKTREEGLRLGPVTDAKIKADESRIRAQAKAEYDLMSQKFKNAMTLEEYTQGQLTARATLDRQSREGIAARDREEKVVATGVDGAGNTVIAKGNDSHVTFRGMRPTPRGKAGDDEAVTLEQARGGGAQPAPAATTPAPIDKAAQLAADKAHLAQVYANASEAAYPGFFRDGKKLPLDELAKALEDDYGS